MNEPAEEKDEYIAHGLTTVPNPRRIIYRRVMERIGIRKEQEINVVMVSSWGERCGVGVYSETLESHLPNWINLERVRWKDFRLSDFSEADIIHLQWEPGLLGMEQEEVFMILKDVAKHVVITTHYYDLKLPIRKLASLVIVHDKRYIIHKNHFYLIQGCPVFPVKKKLTLRRDLGISPDRLVLASFGFIMDWKNLDKWAECLFPFLKLDPRFFAVMLHSIHPKLPEYGNAIKSHIEYLIKVHGLKDKVVFTTDFLDKEKINDYLQASDLGIMYAGSANSTGSSAALKEFISARCPVVASDISHYADLDKGVERIPAGDGLALVYRGLDLLKNSPERLSTLAKEQEENYKSLNYKVFAQTHAELYREVLCQ